MLVPESTGPPQCPHPQTAHPADRSVALSCSIHRAAERDRLETPTHGPTASPSAASSPRRQRPPRWRTTSRSPCPFDGCERSTRRCAPPPTYALGLGSLWAASTSASPPPCPPWPTLPPRP